MKLLLLVCLFALSSALVARRPSRGASGLSPSSRINSYDLTARDDDFDYCGRHESYGLEKLCWECNRGDSCGNDADCRDDDDDDDDDREYCVRGYCCELEGESCTYHMDCEDDDDDD